MKLMKVLSLSGAVLVPHLAFADTHLAAGLGQTKAIYDYCSRIDPADAATFAKMWSYAAGGNANLPYASGFQAIYNSTLARLQALPKSRTASGCHGGATEWAGVNGEVEAGKLRPLVRSRSG
jgi:hypothetical protein